MSPRGIAAVTLLVFPLMVSGCSIPSWMPLIGKSKPAAPAEAPRSQPPASAPILTSRDQLHDSEDVVDRVICVVNNDAITQYELDEAELYYLAETRERPTDGDARQVLREQLLQNLIENRIQLQQAERDKVVIEDAELTEALGRHPEEAQGQGRRRVRGHDQDARASPSRASRSGCASSSWSSG